MNFNLVEMYNGLLRFNKHILNELAEGLKLCTIENIEVADDNARKNKNKKYGINKHDKNRQYENEDLVNYAKHFRINFIRNGKAYYADSRDKTLFYSIHRLNHFPINFKITKYDWRIYAKNRKEKVKPQT